MQLQWRTELYICRDPVICVTRRDQSNVQVNVTARISWIQHKRNARNAFIDGDTTSSAGHTRDGDTRRRPTAVQLQHPLRRDRKHRIDEAVV